jgi:hypothetical protein
MRIDSAGGVGIGSSPFTATKLIVAGSLTGATTGYGVLIQPTVQPDVTSTVYLSRSQMSTAANGGTPYTISNSYGYYATQGTYNADSTVTTQSGFAVPSAFIGATNNRGFVGDIASGTGRYNLYMSGTADNYLAGALGIGTTSVTARRLAISGNSTGATSAYGVLATPTVQPDVTAAYSVYQAQPATAANGATPYTITSMFSYVASQGTFNADSTVTNQYGFNVSSALTGATNNFGFYGNLASGTGRWNLYMSGTANNYMAGALGIGTTSLTATKLNIAGSITGATTGYGVLVNPTVQPDVTGNVYLSRSQMSTAANGGTPYTITGNYCYYAVQGTYNADSTVTTQVGFAVPSAFIGATNNYAFFGQLASGTGRYNLFMGGTAQNYIAGNVGIGASIPATKLEIAGSNNSTWSATATSISGTTMTIAGTVTGTIAIGDLVFGTGVQPYTCITAGSALSWTVSVYQTVASATLVGGATYGDTLIRITDTDTSVAAGQPTGGLQFYTSDTSTPAAGVGAYVAAISEAVTPDTSLVFGTRDNAGGGIDANERMRIDSSGNVGIGTSSPSSPLNVVSASSSLAIAINGRSSDNLGAMYFYANNGSTQYSTLTASATEFRISSVPAAAVQTFYTNGSERMRIDSSGNLLIGTSTSPAGSKELVLGGDYIEAVVAIGTVTTTNTISLANGTLQTATLTASTACTFTMPTAIAGKSFTLLLKQAASTGNGTATFTSVKWGTSGAPTITATAGKMDILTFASDGTNWYGSIAQGYTP